MKKGVRGVLSTIIIVAFLFSNAFASDVSKTKRHVAMVYDDSTSMYISDKTDEPVLNWSYANYMTQAFLALLNPQDSLYITYMSDTEKDGVSYSNLLDGDRESAIDNIRNKNDYINKTPFEAVETAYNMLKNLDEDDSDEYWLVIATDGAFTNLEEDVTEKLLGYIDEMAKLGRTLKVVFLAIGSDANPPVADEDKGLLVYETGLDDIVSAMSSLADNISGRHNVSTSRMSVLSGNRLSVDMLLPVRSLIIFTQSDANTFQSIENSDGEEMEVTDTFSISAPETFEFETGEMMLTDENAVGTITKISPANEGDILSDGRYVLTFAKEPDTQNIRVMYEPAIDITVRYKQDGKILSNPEDGSVCDIEIILTNAHTGNALNSKVLPAEVECSIQIASGGEVIDTVEGFTAQDVTLVSGQTAIITEISMPGYFTLRNRLDYVYDAAPEAEATAVPEGYDESMGPWPPEVELLVQMPSGTNLSLNTLEEAAPFLVIPTFNGEKGELSDLQLGSLELFCSRKIEFEVTIDETYMGYSIAPKYSGDKFLTSTGEISVELIFQSEYGKTAESAIMFNVKDLTWLERNYRFIAIPLAALINTVIILGILVFRKKFAKGAWLEFTQMHKNKAGEWITSKVPSSASLNNLKGKWRIVPFVPERITISHIEFYPANDDQYIIIPKKHLSVNMGTTKGPLTQEELSQNFSLQNGYRFYVETGAIRLVFVYHGPKRTLLTNKNKKR